MNKIYQSPLKVYLALGALALCGIILGFQLPISLFPNSSKPRIYLSVGYGGLSAGQFLNTYGRYIESSLEGMSSHGAEVEKVTSEYRTSNARFQVDFRWGSDNDLALQKVRDIAATYKAQFSQEMRDSTWVGYQQDGSGQLVVSFFSASRTLDQLYQLIKPQLLAAAKKVNGIGNVGMWNPNEKEIRIELNPDRMASLGLFPNDVAAALMPQLQGASGGSLTIARSQLNIDMPPLVNSVQTLKHAVIPTRSGHSVVLSDIARVGLGTPMGNAMSMKTSGVRSVILFARAKPGGNVKSMAEAVIAVIKAQSLHWPQDIKYKILEDPSAFIRSAVFNVFREVVVAAALAVFVLFLFIGNLRNVVTAAIEIPLSMVLAFILMKIAGVNLNLISLAGLALSAGMNVDASVVVMENIFRHFDEAKAAGRSTKTAAERVGILSAAVKEVRFPVVASTIASLVVFIPLAFTSQLTNAILGDLALAVVFSHAFSAVVALILVPTVRLQLMSKERPHKPSLLEPAFHKLESAYARALRFFLDHKTGRRATYLTLVGLLIAVGALMLPKLKREVIGKPNSDWLVLTVSTQGNTLIGQMDSVSGAVEARLFKKFGTQIQYTFTQTTDPNFSVILIHIKDKDQMRNLWTQLESTFVNTPKLFFGVSPWNPSALRIPDPPDFQISVGGKDAKDRVRVARDLFAQLREHHAFDRISSEPGGIGDIRRGIHMTMKPGRWSALMRARAGVTPADIADVSRVATTGKEIWRLPVQGQLVPVHFVYPRERVKTLTELKSLPIGVSSKIVPLKALADFQIAPVSADIRRVDGSDQIIISARENRNHRNLVGQKQKEAKHLVNSWWAGHADTYSASLQIDDPGYVLTQALHQLAIAVLLSVLLIFLTMVFQFDDLANAILVLIAVPLGFIGAIAGLFLFHSTLSLNSVLGIILLNGITVANSILLVDFLKKMVEDGAPPKEAAVQSAQKRLRPILMTSITTALGMLPIALGFGEGGRILQPLGISVVCGLAFSMLTTLFVVPALQVAYLSWRGSGHERGNFEPSAVAFENGKLDWIPDRELPSGELV